MRSKKSRFDNVANPEGKPESPDESVKSGNTDLTRRKLLTRVGVVATLLAIGGQAYAFEIAGGGDTMRVQGRIGRQFRDCDPRQLTAHNIPLKRVIIDEYHGIQADIQPLGDISKIASLVCPVGGEAGDVLTPQYHLRVLLERFERVRLIIL